MFFAKPLTLIDLSRWDGPICASATGHETCCAYQGLVIRCCGVCGCQKSRTNCTPRPAGGAVKLLAKTIKELCRRAYHTSISNYL